MGRWEGTGGPAPLERRRRPWPSGWRSVLWRWRFVVAALGVGVSTTAAVDTLRPPEPRTAAVVVAAHGLAAGATLGAADVRVARVPAALVPVGSSSRVEELVGESTAVAVPEGLPLVPGLLASHALTGPRGTVVVAVRLGDPAVAALLTPGARIDVLAASGETGEDGVVVARRALVLPVTGTAGESSGSGGWGDVVASDDSAPVLLAVDPDEAAALSGAAVSAVLSAVVVP